MRAQHVVIGHGLTSYGEAIAGALRVERPALTIHLVDPADLPGAVARHRPALVIGESVPEQVKATAPAWIALYPGGADRADYCLTGRGGTVPGITLEQLLALIDRCLTSPATPRG